MNKTNNQNGLKWSPVVNYNGFEEALDNLPHKHFTVVRREIIKRLRWSPRSFGYKRIGEMPLRENEVPVIQEIFSRYHIDAFTGERI